MRHLEHNLGNHLLLNVKMSVAAGWSCSNIISHKYSVQSFVVARQSVVGLPIVTHTGAPRTQSESEGAALRKCHKNTIILCWILFRCSRRCAGWWRWWRCRLDAHKYSYYALLTNSGDNSTLHCRLLCGVRTHMTSAPHTSQPSAHTNHRVMHDYAIFIL